MSFGLCSKELFKGDIIGMSFLVLSINCLILFINKNHLYHVCIQSDFVFVLLAFEGFSFKTWILKFNILGSANSKKNNKLSHFLIFFFFLSHDYTRGAPNSDLRVMFMCTLSKGNPHICKNNQVSWYNKAWSCIVSNLTLDCVCILLWNIFAF